MVKANEMSIQDWEDLNRFLDHENEILDRPLSSLTSDAILAIDHILKVIEKRDVKKCTQDTQESYVVLKDLKHKLENEYVIYRPQSNLFDYAINAM